jgi:amino acid transporter
MKLVSPEKMKDIIAISVVGTMVLIGVLLILAALLFAYLGIAYVAKNLVHGDVDTLKFLGAVVLMVLGWIGVAFLVEWSFNRIKNRRCS